ncbi:MAG: UDP-N-acetylglucosamine 1-carboxyvinyltransferase [Myxococcota bacterium]
MDRFVIQGGVPLQGRVRVSGSKNSSLALIAAGLLGDEPLLLRNVPGVRDLRTMLRILEQLGVDAVWDGEDELRVGGEPPRSTEAPYELVRTMRASFMVLGPLLARCGHARVSLPGGCAIGARPVDQHLKGLEALGAKVELDGGYVEARARRLRGGRVAFDVTTVNGTQNVLMAAVLAEGETRIENAAQEPEVVELIDVLRSMGARIDGAGTERLVVEGVPSLSGAAHRVAGDRIEAGTLAVAAAITGGEVELEEVRPGQLRIVLEKLREIGLAVEEGAGSLRVRRSGPLRGVQLRTAAYPGFPTDMQAQLMALLSLAEGSSTITETVFENRFMHVSELQRMGARIALDGRTAMIRGVPELLGAPVMATDLRASASLVLAGLAARGETNVLRVYHIDRGYDCIEAKLASLGARIRRERS